MDFASRDMYDKTHNSKAVLSTTLSRIDDDSFADICSYPAPRDVDDNLAIREPSSSPSTQSNYKITTDIHHYIHALFRTYPTPRSLHYM